MFGRKKADEKPPRERKPRGNLPLIGFEADMDDGDDGDDGDLEKELAALVGGGKKKVKSKPKQQVSPDELNAMVAAAMKDYDDEDLSDTDDPDLLAELEDIQDDDEDDDNTASGSSDGFRDGMAPSFTQTIRERLSLYREAESVAVSNGDSSRARRYNRGVKTLLELERRAVSGGAIREDDIPPLISVGKRRDESSSDNTPASESAPAPPRPAPAVPDISQPPPAAAPAVLESVPAAPAAPVRTVSAAQSQVSHINSQLSEISSAREVFKKRALSAKTGGDKETALNMMKFIKICDNLTGEVKQGNIVDLSVIRQDTTASVIKQQRDEVQTQSVVVEAENVGETVMTIQESLTQRRDKYAEEESKAATAGNESKARRMGRIKKQYDDALRLHKTGKPIPRADLPDPPGFPPIPTSDPPQARKPSPQPPSQAAAASSAVSSAASPPKQSSAAGSTPPRQLTAAEPVKKGPSPARQTSVMSLQEKQLASLVKKQQLFKEAAIKAKQQGQMETAKDYLKQSLSFNKLIEVSKAGLPVDMTTLPVPPQQQVKTDMDFEIVSREECSVVGDREEMFSKLEQDLISQVKMCMTNRSYFKEVGDIASSNKFEQMALNAKKDLDAVRNEFKRGGPVPKFHYETRAFSRVVSNTDLTDNDLELSILNGINYVVKNPKEVDTYIKWEFPFPRDAPTVDKTSVVKDSNNPQYDFSQKLVINPRDKTFQRVVKRGQVKMEVWSKGGFLRSDTLIGTANMKLAPLETVCTIHDSYDLYDGRKPVGGKIEAKLRIRNGVLAKQIEQVQEKWLVLQF